MARSFMSKIRKYRTANLIASIIALILLVILGFALGPDKTWGPRDADQSESR